MLDFSKYGYSGDTPLPVFNTKWYSGSDSYSDGDVEETILKIIAQNNSTDYSEAITRNFSWPVFYHLTHFRQNILNWYAFQENSDILEIGCGMGAITELLCQKAKSVTSVELSKRRASAAYLRCRNYSNLEIIVGNLNDIEFEKKFDYITLIGVLEYQGRYTDSENPFKNFLSKIKSLLKPNGKLLIAIENKYGLKYWCGAREDHTAIPFDGLNQYILSKTAQTFSRQELAALVKSAGFENSFFYYPLPDYKFPQVIYSDEYLPKNSSIDNWLPYYYPDTSTMIADETLIYKDIIKNNVFPFFSNSFFVECAVNKNDHVGYTKYIVSSPLRKKEYRINTVLNEDGFFKYAEKASENQLYNIENIYNNLIKSGINIAHIKKDKLSLSIETITGTSLTSEFIKLYETKDIDSIISLWKRLYCELKSSSPSTVPEKNILITNGLTDNFYLNKNDKLLEYGYIDMIHKNCFVNNDKFTWIDQEWAINGLPASLILFYNIYNLYSANSWMEKILPAIKLLDYFEISVYSDIYTTFCKSFIQTILDPNVTAAYGYFRRTNFSNITDNIDLISRSKYKPVDNDLKNLNEFLAKKDFDGAINFVTSLDDQIILKKFPKMPALIVKYLNASDIEKNYIKNYYSSYEIIESSNI